MPPQIAPQPQPSNPALEPFRRETARRLEEVRGRLGRRVLILGHHYMSDEVIAWADAVGDSLALSRLAAADAQASHIVFCGVHFMAETADILATRGQRVILPDGGAGCPMADMAAPDQVERCWRALAELGSGPVIPITYVNSSAALKAFCGRHGGAVCTSSNAVTVLRWALEHGQRALFFPDEHLGRNAAAALGLADDDVAIWRRAAGRLEGDAAKARVVVWDGFCPVHVRFGLADVARARLAGARVIVHPECPRPVVQAADDSGSTEKIIAVVGQSPAGSVWAVGTEINLVRRLAARHADKTIFSLNEVVCACPDMAKISQTKLLASLEGVEDGRPRGVVSVEEHTARWAAMALERMLDLS